MKTTKIIITVLFYVALFYLCSLVYYPAVIGYGEVMGAIFTFFSPVVLLFNCKRIYKASEKIIALFVKI